MTYYSFIIYRKFFFFTSIIIISAIYLSVIYSSQYAAAPSETGAKREFEIIKSIPFKNTTLSSIAVDPIRNLVFVSTNPSYPYDHKASLCREENDTSSYSIPNSVAACSAIHIIDGNTGNIKEIIKLSRGEIIHDMNMDINLNRGKVYAVGEYNYLENDTNSTGDDPIQYEDDVAYIIHVIPLSNTTELNDTNKTRSRIMNVNDIQRIKLYGETEEGKEGDMSSISVDYNKIYAGIRYFQGGREGIFVIDDNGYGDNATESIKFIPLGETGPDRILSNKRDSVYTSLEDDNFIAVLDGSSGNTKEEIILQKPRAMSINPSAGLLYVSSGYNRWFNVIDTDTNKVVAANTEISHPITSVANHMTGRVYVTDCRLCDQNEFTNGTSIFELNIDGSTINSKIMKIWTLKKMN